MTLFDTSIPGFGEPSIESAEEKTAIFFTIHDPADLSHRARCELHELISSGSRPTDYTLELISIEMNRPEEETLSKLLYILGEMIESIELPLFVIKLLHDDHGIKMFTNDKVVGTAYNKLTIIIF